MGKNRQRTGPSYQQCCAVMADQSIGALARAHLVNPAVRAVLRSRGHRLLSGNLLLLDYTGRRTGHRFILPVATQPTRVVT